MRTGVICAYVVTLDLLMFNAAPARALTKSPSPPTTSPLHALNNQATNALRPLIIFAAVIVAMSAITGELAHRRRRRPKATSRSQARRQRKPPRTITPMNPSRRRKTARPRPGQPSAAEFADMCLAPPPTVEAAHMWGRTPGGSAAQRAAELERERASWAAGHTGEQRVAAELDLLPVGEWWVFHDLPRGPSGTNVDHLVVGVGGVFALNTKHLSGTVWVGKRTVMVAGVKTNYLPVAVSEARNIGQRLSAFAAMPVSVWPVLVFVHPLTVAAMPPDVAVLQLDNLRVWLLSLPAVLTPARAYDIALAADRPATWA